MGAVVVFPFGERAADVAAMQVMIRAQREAVTRVMAMPAHTISAGRRLRTANYRERLEQAIRDECVRAIDMVIATIPAGGK